MVVRVKGRADMAEIKIEISDDANIELVVYDNGDKNAYLNYIEHATDYWSSDEETSEDLEDDKLNEIYEAIGKYLGK